MKTKSLLFTAIATLIGVSAFATTDKAVVGGYGDYKTRVALPSGDYNVILVAPTEDVTQDGTMFTANGSTITSLDGATNTAKTRWNFTSTLTVDINSAVEGNVDAIKLGTNSTRFNKGHINIKNTNESATSDTVATIDVGKRLYFTVNGSSEKSTFNIYTNANITGTKLDFDSAMTKGGYFIMAGTTTHSVSNSKFVSGTSLSVASGAKFNATSGATLTFQDGSSFNVASGANASFYKIATTTNSAVNVSGALKFNGTNATLGKLVVNGGSFVAENLAGDTNARIVITGADSIVKNAGTISIKGGLEIKNADFTIDSTSGKIQFTDYDATYEGRLILTNGKLTVEKSGVIDRTTATGAKSDVVNLLFNGQSNEFVVNATTKIKQIYGYNVAPELLITLSNNSDDKLILTSGVSSFSTPADTTEALVKIANFGEERVFIESIRDELTYSDKFTLITSENEEILFKKGTYNGTAGFWMTTIAAVPEPAEWAMIFGGIALGLAIYRRRK